MPHQHDSNKLLAAGITPLERRQARLDDDAARILEAVLRRQRWTAETRDALSAAIGRVVDREIRIAKGARHDG